MTPKQQIKRIHLEDQMWRHMRELRRDMEKVVMGITSPGDVALLKGLCIYALMHMDSEDLKMEETN